MADLLVEVVELSAVAVELTAVEHHKDTVLEPADMLVHMETVQIHILLAADTADKHHCFTGLQIPDQAVFLILLELLLMR
jgi:hypothetical protein